MLGGPRVCLRVHTAGQAVMKVCVGVCVCRGHFSRAGSRPGRVPRNSRHPHSPPLTSPGRRAGAKGSSRAHAGRLCVLSGYDPPMAGWLGWAGRRTEVGGQLRPSRPWCPLPLPFSLPGILAGLELLGGTFSCLSGTRAWAKMPNSVHRPFWVSHLQCSGIAPLKLRSISSHPSA